MTSSDFSSTLSKTELQLYLDEPKLKRDTDVDVLDFWKTNQGRYPTLSSMARDILVVPILTTASEASYSVGGRVLAAYHS